MSQRRVTLKSEWEDFKRECLSKVTDEDTISNVKTTFYSGAIVAFNMIIATSEPEISEDEGVAIIEEIRKELDAFGKENHEELFERKERLS